MSDGLRIVLVLLLVFGNAFFVAAEYALVTARRTRLHELAIKGSRRARIALRIMDSPVRFIGTVQLGITAFSIALGAIGEPLVEHFLNPILATGIAFILAFAIVTYLHVTLGELVPKAVALTKNESTALSVALPVEAFYLATYPIVWFLQASANAMTRLVGIEPAPAGVVAHTEEDIRMIVAHAEDTGVLEHDEREMLYKVFDFADKEVADVMVPRPDVVALSVALTPDEAMAAMLEAPYTRYPVYRDTLDEIVGIVHVRDLVASLHNGASNQAVALVDLVRSPYVVPETKDLGALLADFRRTSQHMAVVVDEYGATAGIVTLEDLLEEIVGDIEDEFDLPDESVERVSETTIRIDGSFTIDDFNEEFGADIDSEDFHTVAGFVFGHLGRAAEVGDEVVDARLRFRVLDTSGSRIQRLEIEFLPAPVGADDTPEAA